MFRSIDQNPELRGNPSSSSSPGQEFVGRKLPNYEMNNNAAAAADTSSSSKTVSAVSEAVAVAAAAAGAGDSQIIRRSRV